MEKLGIIGLGSIGYPIANRLIEHNFQLYSCVRSEHSRKKALELGIEIVTSVKALSEHTDKILIIVSNYEECCQCLMGCEGLFSSMKKGCIIISSTIAPEHMKNLADLCPNEICLIDAPISGGVSGAENGTLVSIVAGKENDVKSCFSVFKAYSKKIVFVGKQPGQAQSLKAINQMLVSINIVATAEALSLSNALGIDPEKMFDTISDCSGNSNIFQSRMPCLIKHDFTPKAALKTLQKDTQICMNLATENNVPSYLTTLCHDLFFKASQLSSAEEDASAVILTYEKEVNSSTC